MSASELAAEARRRQERRAQGLPLHDDASIPDDGSTSVRASVAFVPYQDPADPWVMGTATVRRVSIPWSLLVSDNDRMQPVVREGMPRLVLSKRYKEAKQAVRVLLIAQTNSQAPLMGRVRVTATFIEPNAHRVRDLSNFAKFVHDALSSIAYVDDGQIDVLTWRRSAPCIDRPRLEIAVEVIE